MAIIQRGTALYAADGVSGDLFGWSSAISSDGAVLVVGAPFRASGALPESGGVYVYDWSGGAWVQRGGVLTAPTPEEGARYGYGVALSADGLVLAVGAPAAVHGSYYGYVYVYDWSGSAWVLRGTVSRNSAYRDKYGSYVALSGNGLVLAAADYWNAGFYIYDWSAGAWVSRGLLTSPSLYSIGTSVALSSDGAILAAGYTGYSYLATDRGAVVLFDYAGSVWTERATLAVVPTGYVASDFFGASVSLSSDGATLYSGANGWDGAGGNSGKAYALDYAAGAWGSAAGFTPDDAATSDSFGDSVTLSANGLVVAVGATGWEGAGAVYVFDVSQDFVTAPTTLTVITAPSGPAAAPTTLHVAAAAVVAGPASLSVIAPSGGITAPTALTMTSTGSASAPTLLAMIAPAPAIPAMPGVPGMVWSARCLIDGVDMSARLEGQASVTAVEGAARIASITLRPPAGLIEPLDYVGKPITLDYVLVIDETAVPRRIFTGRVDTPAYDPVSTLLTLSCTDDLQNVIAALPRGTVDHLVGGLFTDAVQGKLDDGWDYAQARLTTVAGSLDASASGGLRTTLWDTAGTWATFTESDLIYPRAQLTLPQRSTLVNRVDIGFDYRYTRLRQRQTTVGWSVTESEFGPNGLQHAMERNGFQFPTQQDILGAAEGSGWTVTQGVFYPAPAAIEVEFPVGPSLLRGFFHPPAGAIEMAVLHLAHRHSQTVTERYTITVTADASVAVNGELPSSLRGALASDFSGSAWESAFDVMPLMPGGGALDYAPDADRAAADYAIQTLLDQARVKILSSHRSGRVGNAILCNPDLDIDKRVAIDTAEVSASGKVAQLVHVLDFAEGSAITEFSLAVFGAVGAFAGTPDPLYPPPPRPMFIDAPHWAYEIPPLGCHTYGTTPYDEGLMGLLLNPTEGILVEDIPYWGSINIANPFYVAGSYPVTGFRMQMPGVSDADRNPIDDPIAASYSIIVPTDTLTFTVP